MLATEENIWSELRYEINPHRWVETTVLTAAAPLLALWLRPHDPLFLDTGFPWLTLPPLLIGLRYGFAHAFASGLGLVFAVGLHRQLGMPAEEAFPFAALAGMMLVGLLAGEFSDMWVRRIRRLEVVNDFRRERLTEFTQSYHLLKTSHDQLEERLLGTTQSLREALSSLKNVAVEAGDDFTLGALANSVMEFFGTQAMVQTASLHGVDDSGKVDPKALAVLGSPEPIDVADEMIARAVSARCLVSVRPEHGRKRNESELLAAIPLSDMDGTLWGVIAIHSMPFIALNRDHLGFLSMIAGHIADLLSQRAEIAEHGDIGAVFRKRITRSYEDARQYGVPTTVVGIVVDPGPLQSKLLEMIRRQRRDLDFQWSLKNKDGHPVILMSMPLTDKRGLRGYRSRIESQVAEVCGVPCDSLGWTVNAEHFPTRKPIDQIVTDLRKACRLEEAG